MLRLITLACSLTFLFHASSSVARADSWPQWRGTNRDGVSAETGLLKEWPAGGPPLAWKTDGLGAGYSGVSIADGGIFTMGDGPDSSFIYGLDEKDGKRLWSARLGRPGERGGYHGPRATPTVDGALVFGLGQFGDLVCVERNTGRERWRTSLSKDFDGRAGGWGYSESPLIDGDKLICSPGGPQGTLLALNKETGAVIWRTKDFTDSAEYSSPIVTEIAGERQYIQLTGNSVAGVAAGDGRVLWRASRRGSTAVIPTPIFHDNHVYVTSGYGIGCNLFKITKAGSDFKAEEVYANKVMVNHHGGVVRVGEHLYGHSDRGGWTCQAFKSGNVVWSEKGIGKGSLVCADGHLYLRSEGSKGTVALIEAAPAGYKEKGRFDQPQRSGKESWPHPVVANGKLYLRDQDLLLCYDVRPR
jgi:outer membrane protein assembly factor BamB